MPADLTPNGAPHTPATDTSLLRRWTAPFIQPTPTSLRRLALAGVVVNAGIVASGGAVRLSDSGLGCLDWPKCTKASLAAAPHPGEAMFHTWIEFGNRLLAFVLLAVGVAVLVAAWRFRPPGSARRRTDLVVLAAMQPLGVVVQAVVGGVAVLTHLAPGWVSAHFLVTVAVLAATVALHVRSAEGTAPPTWLVRKELRAMGVVVLLMVLAMLAAGTVVTGTGPLAGAPGTPRYHLPLVGVTQFHADIGWLMGGLAFALVLGLRLTGAPERISRAGYLLLALMGFQGLIGYIQYFNHLPAGIVWVHESTSVLIWIAALRLWFAMRDRGSIAGQPSPASAAAAEPAPAG